MQHNFKKELILTAIITCPDCGYSKEETMPTNACIFFYTCQGCQARFKPKEGDCCVFCSYGNTPCPPKQANDQTGGCCS